MAARVQACSGGDGSGGGVGCFDGRFKTANERESGEEMGLGEGDSVQWAG
jgi:hypothetical protein